MFNIIILAIYMLKINSYKYFYKLVLSTKQNCSYDLA